MYDNAFIPLSIIIGIMLGLVFIVSPVLIFQYKMQRKRERTLCSCGLFESNCSVMSRGYDRRHPL